MTWTGANSHLLTRAGAIDVPELFFLSQVDITNPQGGWIDLRIGTAVFCYQRQKKSTEYLLVYKKTTLATHGCDYTNETEQDSTAWSLTVPVGIGTIVRVIPRDPKLQSLVWTLELLMWQE